MKKIAFLEALRCIALLLVVLTHMVAIPLSSWEGDTTGSYQIYTLIYALGCCGVPLFLMITGALLLKPDKKIKIDKIFKHMIPRILIPLLCWGWIFACLEIYFNTRQITLDMLFKAAMMVINKETWGHLWYLYMLLGIYIFLPVLKHLSDTLPEKLYLYLTLSLLVVGYIIPTINQILGTSITVNAPLPLCHFAAVWMGYFLERYKEDAKMNKRLLVFGLISFSVLIVAGIANGFWGKGYYLLIARYDSIFILGSVILIYMTVRKILNKASLAKFWISLAECSFGIYLIHPITMNLFYKVVKIQPIDFPVGVSIILFLLLFIVPAWGIVIIMKKIPIIKKLV